MRNGIYSMESALWNLHDGIRMHNGTCTMKSACTIESARWNPMHNGICTIESAPWSPHEQICMIESAQRCSTIESGQSTKSAETVTPPTAPPLYCQVSHQLSSILKHQRNKVFYCYILGIHLTLDVHANNST